MLTVHLCSLLQMSAWVGRMFASVPSIPRDPVAALLASTPVLTATQAPVLVTGHGAPSSASSVYAGISVEDMRTAVAIVAAAGDIAKQR
jgi:hypothetical protein